MRHRSAQVPHKGPLKKPKRGLTPAKIPISPSRIEALYSRCSRLPWRYILEPVCKFSIILAPGCSCGPFRIYYLNISRLSAVTGSGKVNVCATKRGTPISQVLRNGSAEITDLAAKLTRLPIIFILNSPSLRSNNYLSPVLSFSLILLEGSM